MRPVETAFYQVYENPIHMGGIMGLFSKRREKKRESLWKKYRQHLDTGDFERALEVIDQFISMDSGDAEAFLEKADVLCHLKRYREARELFKNLMVRPEQDVRARARLKESEIHIRNGNWERALKGLPSAPPDGFKWVWLDARLRCCYELTRMDDFREAMERHWTEPSLETLENLRDRKAVSSVHTLLASFYEDELDLANPGNLQQVTDHFEKALDLDPENQEARFSLDTLREELRGPKKHDARIPGGKPTDRDDPVAAVPQAVLSSQSNPMNCLPGHPRL